MGFNSAFKGLNPSVITPTSAHVAHKNTVLYRSYIFWGYLRHVQGTLHPEIWKLLKNKVICVMLTASIRLVATYVTGLLVCD